MADEKGAKRKPADILPIYCAQNKPISFLRFADYLGGISKIIDKT